MPDQLPAPMIDVVMDNGEVKIHTFITPEKYLANATHIIESPEGLIIVDGQWVATYARQFRAYADSLSKPIRRVYLSHRHPDHFLWFGAAFEDLDVFALPETIEFLAQNGTEIRTNRAHKFGPLIAEKFILPKFPIFPGEEVVAGLTIEHVVFSDAETDYQLALKLPELHIFIVQDLIYSGLHLFITKAFDNWIEILQGLEKSGCDLFLPGHGIPADAAEVKNNIAYLQAAKNTYADAPDAGEFKKTMLATFPERSGTAILDFCLPKLFN